MDQRTDIGKNRRSERNEAHYLDSILLDSIPHPALLVRKSREVIAANRLAIESGTIVGGFCWRDFGHCLYISDEDRNSLERGEKSDKLVSCEFCKANRSLDKNETINIKRQLGDIYWDIFWVPTKEEGVYLHYAIDITEQRRIQRELEESNQRFKQLTEVSFEGICIHDNGTILDCNTKMESMFGYPAKEVMGMNIFNLIPIDPGKSRNFLNSADQIHLGRYFAVKKDGTSFEVEILSRKLIYSGKAVNVFSIRDNSKRRAFEETIKRTKDTLKEAESIGHIGNVEVDVIKKYTFWSDEVFRIFGYEPQQFKPSYNEYAKHVSETDREFINNQLATRTPSNPSFSYECAFNSLNGNQGWMDIIVDIEFNEARNPVFYHMMIQDITEKKQWELDKKENQLNAELLKKTLEIDKLKTEFLANVSHELRTPLNIIYTTLQLFETYIKNNIIKDSDDKICKRISTMKQNCFRLMRLINNLIEINKVDCGFISMHWEKLDIVEYIEKICFTIGDFMEDKKIAFRFQSDAKAKLIVCDPDKVETVILNLVSNAVKFNKPNGTITVSLHDEGESLLIIVEDSGIGIPKNIQGKIFERFEQVNKSLTRSYEGSGIGLSLSQSFIEMLGGTIWVESEQSRGSKFYVRLPINKDFTKDIRESDFNEMCYLSERVNIELSDALNNLEI